METTGERVTAGVVATLVGVALVTALFVGNRTPPPSSVTAAPRTQQHRGVVIQAQDHASPVAEVAGGAPQGALTLLTPEPIAFVTDEAPLPPAVATVARVARQPQGQLESTAPGVVHRIQEAQAIAAPVTDPVTGPVGGSTAPEGEQPAPGSDPAPPAGCPVLTSVTSVVGKV